jgi:threonine/homoserine/homoserine lactone efflux protein
VNNLFRVSRWKPRHLLVAWSLYWVALVAVTLGPAIAAVLRVTVPAGAKGDVSANFGDGVMHLIINGNGTTLWSGAAKTVTIALWLGGPPLLLWLAWLVARPARQPTALADTTSPSRMLGESPAGLHDREKPRREALDRD